MALAYSPASILFNYKPVFQASRNGSNLDSITFVKR
jgi:hypothetical protein